MRRLAAHREALRRAVSPADLERVLRALVELAVGGDVQAGRVLLDRCLGRPAPEPEPVAVPLPPIASVADLAPAAARVLEALGAGEIDPEAAGRTLAALHATAELHAVADLEERLQNLEEKAGGKSGRRLQA